MSDFVRGSLASTHAIPSLVKVAVQKLIPDADVYLIGSRARGDFESNSNWDFLVLTPRVLDCDELEILEAAISDAASDWRLTANEWHEIDPKVYSNEYWSRTAVRMTPFHRWISNEAIHVSDGLPLSEAFPAGAPLPEPLPGSELSPVEKLLARRWAERALRTARYLEMQCDESNSPCAIEVGSYAFFELKRALLHTDRIRFCRDALRWESAAERYLDSGIVSPESASVFRAIYEASDEGTVDLGGVVYDGRAPRLVRLVRAAVDEVAAIVYNRTPPPWADPEELKE
ncbi:MAG: hypothetical protein GC168_07495 [Candidatus Hydrogenedens sp.]|nr:hypothetical protein [Candidatus Hydrogenedens sp.]